MKTIKRVNVQKGEEGLEILLNAWVKAIIRYTTANERDNPWWYNERASLSVLAGAAWTLKDWHAIEEFSTLKHYRTHEPGIAGIDRDSFRNGRCDLYVQSPNTGFAMEAKQTVQSIGSRSDGCTFTIRAMSKAWEDCGYLRSMEADRRFAVTFIVPSIPRREVSDNDTGEGKVSPTKVDQVINNWLTKQFDSESRSMKYTNFAFVFPQLGNQNYLYGEHYYPGVVVVFKERYRANRSQKTVEA